MVFFSKPPPVKGVVQFFLFVSLEFCPSQDSEKRNYFCKTHKSFQSTSFQETTFLRFQSVGHFSKNTEKWGAEEKRGEMGCVASKLEEEEEVVSICRDRKNQLKLTVERRYTLADAHHRYFQALNGVSAAIKLFVARHSLPSSPYLITLPPPSPSSPSKENVVSNPLFLQQKPSQPTQEAIACVDSCKCATESNSSEEEVREEKFEKKEEKVQQAPVCGYFYMEMPQEVLHSTPTDFGWDFFNPFNGVRPEVVNGYNQISEEDLKAVREREGIPDLEKEEEEENIGEGKKEESKVVVAAADNENVEHKENGVEDVKAVERTDVLSQEDHKGITVMDTPLEGRELLEALKDIEDHFIMAYESGKEVSRMLEANWVQSQPNLEDLKGN